jgi:hypothetical protein
MFKNRLMDSQIPISRQYPSTLRQTIYYNLDSNNIQEIILNKLLNIVNL